MKLDTNHLSGIFAKRTALLLNAISILGFLVALYLTVEHLSGQPVKCIILSGCEKVLTSPYSEVFGVPLALFGAVYYFFIFCTSLFFIFGRTKKLLLAALLATPIGLLASAWFVYLQFFVIKALCIYCMTSALLSAILFLTAAFVFFKLKRKAKEN